MSIIKAVTLLINCYFCGVYCVFSKEIMPLALILLYVFFENRENG